MIKLLAAIDPLSKFYRVRILRAVGMTRWPIGLGYAIGLFLSFRIAYSLTALLMSYWFPLYQPCNAGLTETGNGTASITTTMFGVWRQWDTCYYEEIASNGYLPGSRTVAFFPLYPILMRLATIPLGGSLTAAGLVVSGFAYIAAVFGLHRLISRDFNERVAHHTIVYISVFPSAFYLFSPYTEALFLSLTVWGIYTARRGLWVWAIIIAFLVSLTRTQGCLLWLPLAWEIIRQRHQLGQRRQWAWHLLFMSLASFGGLLGFILYSRKTTGWTTIEAQTAHWGAAYFAPWTILHNSLQTIGDTNSIVEGLNFGLLSFFLVLFLLGLRRLPFSYSLYVAPHLLLLFIRQTSFTPLGSVNRYLLVLFPIFTVLALLTTQQRFRILWLANSAFFLCILLYLFLLGAFVA